MIMMGDRKKMVSAILGPHPGEAKEDEGPDALHGVAQELIEALHARNPGEVLDALRAIFEALDAEPHEEGPHEGEE